MHTTHQRSLLTATLVGLAGEVMDEQRMTFSRTGTCTASESSEADVGTHAVDVGPATPVAVDPAPGPAASPPCCAAAT